jgi:serine/threonine protein kinase
VKCWAVNHEPRDRKITKETIARNEIYINASLSQASCKNILRYRGYGRRNVTFKITTLKHPLHCSSYYIYTDYARAGDLTLLVDSAAEPRQEGHAISEHYIWYTLKCLVDALCVLRDGICPERTSKSGDAATALSQPWISVIHNDIKLENVFLGDNDETYKSYKRILLADFDLSIKHWPGVSEAEHVAAFRHLGTPDWFPPVKSFAPVFSSIY